MSDADVNENTNPEAGVNVDAEDTIDPEAGVNERADAQADVNEEAAARPTEQIQAADAGANEPCFICRMPLEDEETKQWLACGHCTHHECAQNMLEFMNRDLSPSHRYSLDNLKCGVCK